MESAAVPSGGLAAPTRSSPRYRVFALVAAAVSLLLSPITAVWAVAVGVAMLLAGLLARRRRAGRVVLAVAAGILLGVMPYFALAVVVAA